MKKHFETVAKLATPVLLAAILLAVAWVGFTQSRLLDVVGVAGRPEVSVQAWGDYYKSVQEQLAMLISGTEEDGTAIPGSPVSSVTTGTIKVYQPTAADLNVTEASASAIKTAVELIDDAISGTEMQVDVLSIVQVDAGAATAVVTNVTGAAAIDVDYAPGNAFWLESVTLNLNTAPTTSQNFTIVLDAGDGSAYDTTLYSGDLSVIGGGVTDLVYQPEVMLLCESTDAIDVDFTNTDTVTYGLRIVVRLAE